MSPNIGTKLKANLITKYSKWDELKKDQQIAIKNYNSYVMNKNSKVKQVSKRNNSHQNSNLIFSNKKPSFL